MQEEAKTVTKEWHFGLLVAFVAAFAILHSCWLVFDFGGPTVTAYFVAISGCVAALGSAVACLWNVRRREHYARSWTIMGWASLSGAVGQGIWALSTLVMDADPTAASFAEIWLLAAILLGAWAAFCFSARPPGAIAWAKTILDGLIVGATLLFLAWLYFLMPAYRSADTALVITWVTAAYPLAGVLVITVALSAMVSNRQNSMQLSGMPLIMLGTSLVGFLISDIAFSVTRMDGSYDIGGRSGQGWFLGYCAIGLAAAWPAARSTRKHDHVGRNWGAVLPSAAAAIVLGIVFVRVQSDQSLDNASVGFAVALMAFVLVRQAMAVLEEQRLAALLSEGIVARTEQLTQRGQQFEALVEHSSDVIVVLQEDGRLTYVSPSVQHVLGHPAESLTNGSISDIVIADDRPRVMALLAMTGRRLGTTMTAEWRLQRNDGSIRQVEVLVRNLSNEPSVTGIVLNMRDVTERKELEDQLTHQALHDDLTGLANRALLRVRIEQALARWLFQNEPFTLLVLDLDDFKSINDSYGHVAGDNVLKMLSKRLIKCGRRGDTLVRLDGDEYAILLEGVTAEDEDTLMVAQRVIEATQEPMRIEGRMVTLSTSVGLACVTDEVSQADDILRNADLALHTAKRQARGEFVKFEMSMHDNALQRVKLEADLRRAIENDELQLFYQPTIDMRTGKIEGVEALLRWPHPRRGFVSPAEFIPLAEETGLIVPIGTWVLRHACTEMAKWQARYPHQPPLILNVNLSGRQLAQPDVVETARSVLAESGLAPNTLVLEMTESVLLDNRPETLHKMEELVRLGVDLAIDDFGTGYSSLSYLRQFPIGVLKIDRSFVSGLGPEGSKDESALVQAIVDLAKTLQLRTVAEGIETLDQLAALRAMGCDVGQGFLMAKPAPAEDVRRLLESTLAIDAPVPVPSASN